MTKPKPNIYPAEFKESAVKLAIESNKPMAQTAKELGVTRTTVSVRGTRPCYLIHSSLTFQGRRSSMRLAL